MVSPMSFTEAISILESVQVAYLEDHCAPRWIPLEDIEEAQRVVEAARKAREKQNPFPDGTPDRA